ncbi:MAG: hypothetical protein JJ900_03825 [Rhodospirillales bacterium]|nr:hypothetical protein [Rhodospirillales bacterium]MBO6785955.1 hypothetical protein [Rhodospirillales bacterium]
MTTAVTSEQEDPSILSPAFLHSEPVRAFWVHMKKLMRPRGVVEAADFDLMAIHRLAPNIMICDVDVESCRSRLRFVGTNVVEVFGEEPTGRYLDEINVGPYRSQQLAAFNLAVASAMPQWTRVNVVRQREHPFDKIKGKGVSYERLIVPMAGKAGNIRQLASILDCAEGVAASNEFEHYEIANTVI